MKLPIKRRKLLTFLSTLFVLLIMLSCKKNEEEAFFKVTLISNGGTSIAPIMVTKGQPLPKKKLSPNPIVSDGGTFITWYEDAEFLKEFDFNTPIVKDITLYAKWYYKTFKISFVMNGAAAKSDVDIIEGKYLSLDKPNYEGFVFVNWYEDAAMTKSFNFSEPVNSDKTLYARWVIPSPASWFSIDANGVLVGCNPAAGATTVVVPDGVKVIPAWFILANGLNAPEKPGFPTGKDIKEFILPESLESIGEGAFKYAGITTITIPPKIKVLEPVTFEGCSDLKSFIFAPNSSFERIKGNDNNNPVIEASSLTTISFPASLKYVGKYTLAGCSALQVVTFERSASPVIFDTFLPGGGVWLFGGYFPVKIRMPSEVLDAFVSEMRKTMGDYEFENMKGTLEGY
jgi:uncharacterized repeat protein (TIGR02543 family)